MYFCRCCNRNYRCREYRPPVRRPEKCPPPREHAGLFRTASAGGIHFFSPAVTEKEYDLIYLYPGFSPEKPTTAVINFACNITFLNAKADISIQLVRLGSGHPLPVASPTAYRHAQDFSGADALSFTVHDTLSAKDGSCAYLVKLNISGGVSADGMILITDPVLTAIVL